MSNIMTKEQFEFLKERLAFAHKDMSNEAIKEWDGVAHIFINGDSLAPYKVKESLEEIEDLMLRDQFAMSAMNGYLASTPITTRRDISLDSLVADSYDIADAMLKARKEGV